MLLKHANYPVRLKLIVSDAYVMFYDKLKVVFSYEKIGGGALFTSTTLFFFLVKR